MNGGTAAAYSVREKKAETKASANRECYKKYFVNQPLWLA
jgi:hypothetical protein